jgi:hypothetical protein
MGVVTPAHPTTPSGIASRVVVASIVGLGLVAFATILSSIVAAIYIVVES